MKRHHYVAALLLLLTDCPIHQQTSSGNLRFMLGSRIRDSAKIFQLTHPSSRRGQAHGFRQIPVIAYEWNCFCSSYLLIHTGRGQTSKHQLNIKQRVDENKW